MKPAPFYILPAILLVALIACSNTDDPINYEDLLGVVWNIDSLQTPDTAIVALAAGYATVLFTEDMRVRGLSTVSIRYHGIYEVHDNGYLSIEVVEPAELRCSRPAMECIFIDALETVTTYEVNEDRLRLYQSDQYVLHFHSSLFDDGLFNVVWQADSLQTPEAKIVLSPDTSIITIIKLNDTTSANCPFDTSMTILFGEDMRTDGFLVCNQYSGTYEIAEMGTLTTDVLIWNESACGMDLLCIWLEGIYRNSLENVTAYEVSENRLTLYDSGSHYVVAFSAE